MDTSIQAVEIDAVRRGEVGPLALWHLLSLDAPTVATVWTWFVARVQHVELPISVPIAMFLAVWLVYAADRLMDTMGGASELEARHYFHREHRRGFRIWMALSGIALVGLMATIPAELLHRYAALGVLLLGWFGLIHLLPAAVVRWLPKEAAPGPFFAAAAFIPGPVHPVVLVGAAFFGLVCVLNCLYIFSWEHPGAVHDAHRTTRLGVRWLPLLSLTCVAGPLLLIWFDMQVAPISVAVAGASALLLGLNRMRGRMERTNLRAAADLVLLTPLVIAPFLR